MLDAATVFTQRQPTVGAMLLPIAMTTGVSLRRVLQLVADANELRPPIAMLVGIPARIAASLLVDGPRLSSTLLLELCNRRLWATIKRRHPWLPCRHCELCACQRQARLLPRPTAPACDGKGYAVRCVHMPRVFNMA